MSMKPGQTTSPFASIRSVAAVSFSNPGGRDPCDPAALQGDVAFKPGVAGAVDHPATEDQHVVGIDGGAYGRHGRGSLRARSLGWRPTLGARCKKRINEEEYEAARSQSREHIH